MQSARLHLPMPFQAEMRQEPWEICSGRRGLALSPGKANPGTPCFVHAWTVTRIRKSDHGSSSDTRSSTMPAMTTLTSALKHLEQERNRLKSQIENFNSALAALKGTSHRGTHTGTMSAAGRARIAAAQRARWAKVKGKKVVAISASKRKMSLAARRRIAAAQKARWAKWRKAQKKG